MMKDKLYVAQYGEWLASLLGACFIAFALGMIFVQYFRGLTWMVLIAGILLHGWGMYMTNLRNK